MSIFCPKCGTALADDARFCSGCGTTIMPSAPTPAVTPAAYQPAVPSAPVASSPEKPEKKHKKKKGLIITLCCILLVVLLAAGAASYFWIIPNVSAKSELIKNCKAFSKGDYREYFEHYYFYNYYDSDDIESIDELVEEAEEQAPHKKIDNYQVRVLDIYTLTSDERKQFIKDNLEDDFRDTDHIRDIKLITYYMSYDRDVDTDSDYEEESIFCGTNTVYAIKVDGEWYFY